MIKRPYNHEEPIRYSYIIQACVAGQWVDVLFSRGCFFTAKKKARHYRNQNKCETRVIEIPEHVIHRYEFREV